MTRAAAGVIYQAGGKVLLMKRRAESVHGGTWGLPAGTIDAGETAEQAVSREFTEETGSSLPSAPEFIGEEGGFSLFRVLGEAFDPLLNDEHTEFVWADIDALPQPVHPGLDRQLKTSATVDFMDVPSAREVDDNGFIMIHRNPISRAGVFAYKGSMIPGADPHKIYNVLRPIEELTSPETLKSFANLPLIDEHVMVGGNYPTAPEQKGIHGWTGDNVVVEGDEVFAPLRIVSRTLKRLIDCGKKGLSLGYTCVYEKSAGVFNGMAYDYIQKSVRGNHLALVGEGRCGTEVLDHSIAFDHFDLALNEGETMVDKSKKVVAQDEADKGEGEGKKEMTLTEITEALNQILPVMGKIQEFMAAAGNKTDDAAAVVLDEDDKKKAEAGDEDDAMKKKACAEDEDDADKKKGEGMDAADIKKRLSAVEQRGTKDFLRDVAARDALVKEISPVVGTFDHAEMTADEVAAYGVKKLGLTGIPAGQERTALNAYLAGQKAKSGGAVHGFAMDSSIKADGLLAKTLKKTAKA